ncbi:MAG: hypothetical protein MJA27_23305 [Pseudanabaenales cyanobacterium]|nr:hypothetical protein [Pseudanabaenales cyanobacterium]
MALNVGKGSFLWDDTTGASDPDKPLKVYYYRPEKVTADTPVWIIAHGMGRNADDYRDYFVDAAAEQGALVIAPQFKESDWNGSTGYNLGNISTSQSNPKPVAEQDWSFSKIEPLFDYVVNTAEPTIEANEYNMFGHSAGAQFVHRFMAWVPDNRVNLAVSANAGWYTVPQSDNVGYQYEWPYSTAGGPDSNPSTPAYDPFPGENIDNFLGSNMVVLLGEDDTKRTSNLRQTTEADKQGKNRFERGQYFFSEGQSEATARGVDFNWDLQTVPNVGHDGEKMAVAAAELFRQADVNPNPNPTPGPTSLIWENLGLKDEAAVLSGSEFDLGSGLTATIDWNTQIDRGSFVPHGGDDFVSYERDMRGAHEGFLNLGFNNDANDPNDVLRLSLHFNQPIVGLDFDVLDVDESSSFEDAVEIFVDDVNIRDIPDAFTLAGDRVKLDNESYLKGFEGRGVASKSSESANIQVSLGGREVSKVEIFYSSTNDAQSNPSSQSIGISDLHWVST